MSIDAFSTCKSAVYRRDGRMVMQRIANPSTSVRFRLAPPNISYGLERGRPTAGRAGDRRRGYCSESGPRWTSNKALVDVGAPKRLFPNRTRPTPLLGVYV